MSSMARRVPDHAILEAIKRYGGNVTDAARSLGLHRTKMYAHLHRMGVGYADLVALRLAARQGVPGTLLPAAEDSVPLNRSVPIAAPPGTPTFEANMSSAMKLPPAVARKPWTPRPTQHTRGKFREAVMRLLREVGHQTDEDGILDSLVADGVLDDYIDRLIGACAPSLEEPEEKA